MAPPCARRVRATRPAGRRSTPAAACATVHRTWRCRRSKADKKAASEDGLRLLSRFRRRSPFVHEFAQRQRTHVGPHLLDVIEALFLGAGLTDYRPAVLNVLESRSYIILNYVFV